MSTLWERLDEALLDEFAAVMGVPDSYDPEDEVPTPTFDPLWVQAFEAGDTWSPDRGPFPALLLLGNHMNIDPGQHGAPVGARMRRRYSTGCARRCNDGRSFSTQLMRPAAGRSRSNWVSIGHTSKCVAGRVATAGGGWRLPWCSFRWKPPK